MSAANWSIVKDLLESCLERPAATRLSFLKMACSDPTIFSEVASLLSAHESATDFLEEEDASQGRFLSAFDAGALAGQRIGAYRLTEEIGRGGMGTVYRAVRDDEEFRMVVAIKIVSRGMDTDSVLRRFRTERQILASLEHPNIARILDGGSTNYGLPYFVMEYIDGLPLAVYCDRQRLTVTERLRLFRKVCNAVAHAHQKNVIHRDLKPGNILVTSDGVPKLLDFGIAKIVSGDDLEPTVTGTAMATPAYASPEQIKGEAVGPASDVYSLGVILYELLTGHRPYRLPQQDSDEVARVICEREPTKASTVVAIRETIPNGDGATVTIDPNEVSDDRRTTVDALRKHLQGDLDTIVSVALRKDPVHRYESVDKLNEDLGRYLEGRPVLARKDSFAYRAGKFIARHPFGLGSGVAAIVLLCALSIYAGWEARRLSNRIAQDHQLASAFISEVHDAIVNLPGSTPAREKLLRKSLDYINGLTRDAGEDPLLHRSLATAYEKFAELQAGTAGAGLGKFQEAYQIAKKAQVLREMLAKRGNDPSVQFDLANNYLLTSSILGRASAADERLEYDRKAVDIAESLVKADPANTAYADLLARGHVSLAYALAFYDRWEESWKHFRRALALRTNAVATAKDPGRARRELARTYYRLGASYAQANRPGEAIGYLKQALNMQTDLRAESPTDEALASDTARTLHFMGSALRGVGDTKGSLQLLNEAVAIREASLARDPLDVRMRALLAGNYSERGSAYTSARQWKEALTDLRRAVEMQAIILDADPSATASRISMADYQGRLGDALASIARSSLGTVAASNWQEAAKYYRRADALYVGLSREGLLRSTQNRADAQRVAEAAAEAARHTPAS